jgi:protein-tyrosine phosphatase
MVDALETGRNVGVHCRQGIGRSALIVGAVLVAAGNDPRRALKVVEQSRGVEVPDTDDQREWLRDFASGLLAISAAQTAAGAGRPRRRG